MPAMGPIQRQAMRWSIAQEMARGGLAVIAIRLGIPVHGLLRSGLIVFVGISSRRSVLHAWQRVWTVGHAGRSLGATQAEGSPGRAVGAVCATQCAAVCASSPGFLRSVPGGDRRGTKGGASSTSCQLVVSSGGTSP